jgi:hypothetical protein
LEEKGVVTQNGELDIHKFIDGLRTGLIDVQVFKDALK